MNEKRPHRARSGRALLTLGTVAAYAAVSITKSLPGWAQDAAAAHGKPREQQNLTVRRLDIPAGPLDETIRAYERVSGVDVVRRRAVASGRA